MIKGLARFLLPLALLVLACNLPLQVTNTEVATEPDPTSTVAAPTETQEESTLEPSTAAPTLTATIAFECPNVLQTRLKVGNTGRVTYTEGVLTRFRRDPFVVNSNIIQLLPDGTLFKIIDGPVCTIVPDTGQAYLFWQVQLVDDPIKGWIAEADASSYFIEPIP